MKRLIFCPKPLTYRASSMMRNFMLLTLQRLLLILFLVFIGLYTYGQTVLELNSELTEMKASVDTIIAGEAAHIKSLVTDLYPTVYIGDVVKASGESLPVRADVKAGAVSKLSIENSLFEQVELITIRINSSADFTTVVDLSTIQGFTNLKYVILLCSLECTAEQLGAIVTGNTTGIKVFYSVSIPS